jgi:hypothetical protein
MRPRGVVVVAFAATMALVGFLLFQIQLVLGKFLLPWFGGSASTWIVCMLFFQMALLAGYALAYGLARYLSLPQQIAIELAILGGSLLLLPITPYESWKPATADDPTWRILALLSTSVGLPYVALATTTPLLTRWIAQLSASLAPSRFFAASNLGSFCGLLTYPFAVEHLLSTHQQMRWWSRGYIMYATLLTFCAVLALSKTRGERREVGRLVPSGKGDPLAKWVACAGLGSTLLLATTNAITQWSAVVPFLWTVPLALYLLTFVMVFGHPRTYYPDVFGLMFLLLAGASQFLATPTYTKDLVAQLALQAATLFAGCMICHAELSRLQPPPERLPRFYLAVAAGGALGGTIVALVAPLCFSDYFEHPLALCAVTTLVLARAYRKARGVTLAATVGTGLILFGGLVAGRWDDLAHGLVVERARNFYGVVEVVRQNAADPSQYSLALLQAGIEQGAQFQSAERKMQPICGFGAESGLGRAIAHHAKRRSGGPQAPLRIGVIGLGAGMVAALGHDGDVMRFYELNPAVVMLAERHFTYLRDSKAKVDVLLGDARLVLERQLKEGDAQGFDVLVLDAFRGASPPLHLMTAEAFEIYYSHLAANGILAINFEIDTFEVAPLHRGMARKFGVDVGWFETEEGPDCLRPVSWALYSKDPNFLETPAVRRAVWPWPDNGRSELVWSDDNANLMSIINWR